MDSTLSSLPKFKREVLRSSSVRLSPDDYDTLQKITTETEAPSNSQAIRLMLSTEVSAVNDGQRSVDSFIFTDEKRPYVISLKLGTDDRSGFQKLKDFYMVNSMADIISHLIKTYGRR